MKTILIVLLTFCLVGCKMSGQFVSRGTISYENGPIKGHYDVEYVTQK